MIYCVSMCLLVIVAVNGVPLDQFLPFNESKLCFVDTIEGLIHIESKDNPGLPSEGFDSSSCSEFSLLPNDDSGSHRVDLSFTFPFYAKRFTSVFINTNGIISFVSLAPTYIPNSFPLRNEFLIAPFWADVDTRGTGEIYFKETSDIKLLKKANSIIQKATHQAAGLSRFKPKWMLIVTWYKVGYYSEHTDKVNTFQALLVTDEIQSFVIFNYLDDGINWAKGDVSLVPAQVGFNFGEIDSLQEYTLPSSKTEMISDIELESNTNNKGQFVFRVDEGASNKTCTPSTEHLIVDPDTPSIINGGVMRLSGPCFNPNNEVIICRFYDTNKNIVQGNINGIITINDTGNEKAICPMPFFKTLGNHSIIITVDNNRKYSGSFTVVPAVYKQPDIKILKSDNAEVETILVEQRSTYNATWDPELLNVNELNESGQIIFQNWIFGLRNKWINRAMRPDNKNSLTIIDDNAVNMGNITFSQNINEFVRSKFDMSLLVLVKNIKNLKIYYASTFLSFLYGGNSVRAACMNWYNQSNQGVNIKHFINCPCNAKSVMFDDEFESDPTCSAVKTDCHENVNANRCYLRKTKRNIGQQCCYDLNGDYTTNGKSAGSADRYYPMGDYFNHQISDYFPYRACCVDSSDKELCKKYYDLRPSGQSGSQCQNDNKKGYANGYGDPHFITLDGKQYTFNGLGRYTLFDVLNGEFVIQIQTKQAVDQSGREVKASSISVIAMKQKNKPTVQAYLHDVLGIGVVVESDLNSDGYDKLYFDYILVRQFDGGQVSVEAKKMSRVFKFENGVVVIVKAANNILSFQLSVPEIFYNKTKGLLGVWNDKQDDDFLTPFNIILPVNSTDEEIFYQFGKTWTVVEKDSLIIVVKDAPITAKPKFSVYEPLFETPSVDPVTKTMITGICGGNSECAYDIAVTGNFDVGRETLKDIKEQMIILNQTLPIVCDPSCQNNAPCVANNTCNCNTGFAGKQCEEKKV